MVFCKLEKDDWSYKVKGIRLPTVSEPARFGEKIYFSVSYEVKDSHKTRIIEIDLNLLQDKTILEMRCLANGRLLVDHDKIFAVSAEGTLSCINAKNNYVIWERSDITHANIALNTNAAIFQNSIIVSDSYGDGDKYVYCIDELSQRTKWYFNCKSACVSDFHIENNRIYFGTETGVYCIYLDTGDVLWEYERALFTKKVECFSDNELAVMGADSIVILEKSTGKRLYELDVSATYIEVMDKHIFTPLRSQSLYKMFVRNRDGGLTCYHYTRDMGLEKRWYFNPKDTVAGGFYLFEGKVLCSAGSETGKVNNVHLLDADTGTELACQKTKNFIKYILQDGTKFFLFSDKGQIELSRLIRYTEVQ